MVSGWFCMKKLIHLHFISKNQIFCKITVCRQNACLTTRRSSMICTTHISNCFVYANLWSIEEKTRRKKKEKQNVEENEQRNVEQFCGLFIWSKLLFVHEKGEFVPVIFLCTGVSTYSVCTLLAKMSIIVRMQWIKCAICYTNFRSLNCQANVSDTIQKKEKTTERIQLE